MHTELCLDFFHYTLYDGPHPPQYCPRCGETWKMKPRDVVPVSETKEPEFCSSCDSQGGCPTCRDDGSYEEHERRAGRRGNAA